MKITGLHKYRRGRNRWCLGGVRGTKLNAHTPTDRHTLEARIIKINKPMLSANGLGIFSQAPAHRRPLYNGETSSRASRAPTSFARSDIWLHITRSLLMRSVSLSLLSDAISEETLNRGWVGMGWWVSGLLLGASVCAWASWPHHHHHHHPLPTFSC